MRKKFSDKTLVVVSFVLTVILLAALHFIGNSGKSPSEGVISSDTVFSTRVDTIFKRDTFKTVKLVPKQTTITRVDTLYTCNVDEPIILPRERKTYQKTIVNNQDTADVHIVLQGIDASIDTLNVTVNRRILNTTNTVEVTKYVERKKTFKDRIHLSPQIGFGYGLINKKADAYVGFGVSIDI